MAPRNFSGFAFSLRFKNFRGCVVILSCHGCVHFRRDTPPFKDSGVCVKRNIGVYASQAAECEYYDLGMIFRAERGAKKFLERVVRRWTTP